ncbi:MAG: hypothetical protein GXO97_06495 [Nitrospirae bacterium]|nr:hypothetical protein [Nitrospirota bacterium]
MTEELDKSAVEVLDESANLVGVRFRPCGKIYLFDAGDLDLSEGDTVVVESMFGLTLGRVIKKDIKESDQKEVKKVIRKATEEDLKSYEDNRSLEEEARRFCLERIKARGLPMKLVTTEATLDRKRIIFYFTADGRIDFRELVKDLAAKFRTRIEMRQIGVRDEAKLLGGLGICGRQLCCNSFLSNFAPISIRMAKEQELVLNTSKLTGICGRLMCCLGYEYDGPVEGEIDEALESCLCEECEREDLTYNNYLKEEKKATLEEYVKGDDRDEDSSQRPPENIPESKEESPVEDKQEITGLKHEESPVTEEPVSKTEEPQKKSEETKDKRDRRKRFKRRKGVSSHKKRKKKKKRKGR